MLSIKKHLRHYAMKRDNIRIIIIGLLLILLSVSGASATLYDDFTGANDDPVDSNKWDAYLTTISNNEGNIYSDRWGEDGYMRDDAWIKSLNFFTTGANFKYRYTSVSLGSGHLEHVFLNILNDENTGYYIEVYKVEDQAEDWIRLFKRINGIDTILDSATSPFIYNTQHGAEWHIYSDNIIFTVDGVTILESTNTISGFGGGYFNIKNMAGAKVGDYNIYIDDVYGTTTSPPENNVVINLNDNCANLLVNTSSVVYDKDDNMRVLYEGTDNPIIIRAWAVSENDALMVAWSTWRSIISKTCIAQFDHDINLFDPIVYWVMNINVYDNETNPIDHANVDFNQDCVIFGYATRNKYTDSSGLANFYRCENKNALLTVSKNGYQTLSENISGGWYDVHQNTYEISVILQPSEDSGNNSNSTVYNDTVNDTNATEIPEDIPNADGIPESIQLYFRDTAGFYTTEVKDTDDYVRCYYSVKSSDPLYMTLKFQKSPNGWDWFNADTYGYYIDNNSYGYFEIDNSYFNDSTLMYRAYIYDDDYYFSDRYAYLSVVNETNDSESHYENLTGMCMFMHKQLNNTIDYREDIVCYTLIDANTNALKTVSLELYKEDTLIDYKNLTYNDLDADSMYGWYLGYTYEPDYNYSLVLKAADGSILDTDNIRALSIIGNKLTVKVTDTLGHNLSHAYVFVEHYGSINTGYQNYGAFEGLPNGESRYKASKSGYRSSAWRSVNLTDENKVVTCSLGLESSAGTSSANPRMSDSDTKNLFYPLMYFLGLVLIMGALMNVIK